MVKAKKTKKTVRKQRPVVKRTKKVPQPSMKKQQKVEIDFCTKCGAIMVPEKSKNSIFLRCRKCGKIEKKNVKFGKVVEDIRTSDEVPVLEKDETLLPVTDMLCEKCNHPKAYWWLQQTKEADEPPTQFFRCVKCQHTWREYR